MNQKNSFSNLYDDGNIPKEDLPNDQHSKKNPYDVELLPETTRPRKDGPGGENGI